MKKKSMNDFKMYGLFANYNIDDEQKISIAYKMQLYENRQSAFVKYNAKGLSAYRPFITISKR